MAADYGYTTTYGANGGADSGGFVAGYGGSQGGSQDSPGGSKTHGKDTLRPVTIKQIIDAVQPHPDAFKIDGSEVTQVTFVGQVHSIFSQTTNITYKLDDGTGIMAVKRWVNLDADPETAAPPLKEGQYVRVVGRLKEFDNKRHIGCHIIRPVTDYNEINMHLLEATVAHLYFTRGPPETIGAIKTEGGNDMFVDSHGGSGGGGVGFGGKPLPNMSATARKVFNLLQSAPQNNEGLHVHNIAVKLGIPSNDVFKAGDELLSHGIIYTTVDDETWAVLEY